MYYLVPPAAVGALVCIARAPTEAMATPVEGGASQRDKNERHIVLTRRQAWRYSVGLILMYHVVYQLAFQLRGQLASIRLQLSTDLGRHMMWSSSETTNNLRGREQYMHDRRRALLNASSIMRLGQCSDCPEPSAFFYDYFDGEMEFARRWHEGMEEADASKKEAYLDMFVNPNRGDIIAGGVCDAYLAFKETGGIKRKHILVAGINENWGEFSSPVPNRTVDWGDWKGHFEDHGCHEDDLWTYLAHENVSAVFTTTHQIIDHPKVFSVPLGVHDPDILIELRRRIHAPNRTELLVINQSPFGGPGHRPAIANSVMANFNGTIENAYVPDGDKYQFWESLRRAKFVLAPSGLGWDTYRAWEALALGTIPVLERYYRKDGFYSTFDDLPVLWVDHFDNVTPALLEAEYPRIVSRARQYKFEKLTNWWWVDLINSYRERPGRSNIQRKQKRDIAKRDNSQSDDIAKRQDGSQSSDAASSPEAVVRPSGDYSLKDAPGVTLWRTQGNPVQCSEVIYYVDSRLPEKNDTFVHSSWESASHIVLTSPTFNDTCLAFFRVSEDEFDDMGLHPVWGRIPATTLAVSTFPNAKYLLYLDTDAVLASPRFNLQYMYAVLAHGSYGGNATVKRPPSLIVNKPFMGWLCSECERFGLGHGCFNSGALLWRKSEGMYAILWSWWAARLHSGSQNFFVDGEKGQKEHFHGWDETTAGRDKMSEQNRLMHIYHSEPDIQRHIWPVPRQVVEGVNTESCPNYVGHVPCLQSDSADEAKWREASAHWNPNAVSKRRRRKGGEDPFCFIDHYCDDKEQVRKVYKMMVGSKRRRRRDKE